MTLELATDYWTDPAKMAVDPRIYDELASNQTHVFGKVPLVGNLVFPYTAHA